MVVRPSAEAPGADSLGGPVPELIQKRVATVEANQPGSEHDLAVANVDDDWFRFRFPAGVDAAAGINTAAGFNSDVVLRSAAARGVVWWGTV